MCSTVPASCGESNPSKLRSKVHLFAPSKLPPLKSSKRKNRNRLVRPFIDASPDRVSPISDRILSLAFSSRRVENRGKKKASAIFKKGARQKCTNPFSKMERFNPLAVDSFPLGIRFVLLVMLLRERFEEKRHAPFFSRTIFERSRDCVFLARIIPGNLEPGPERYLV